jgi:hypothetical protein
MGAVSSSGARAGVASGAATSGETSRHPETRAGIGPEEAGYKVRRRALWRRFEEATLEERSTMANYMVFIHTALGTLAGYMVRESLHR